MKLRVLLSTFFAAFGVYLFSVHLFSASTMIGALLMMPSFDGDSINRFMIPLQYVAYLFPVALSILLILFSRRLGILASRFAGVTDDMVWDLQIGSRELLATLFAGIGVYLIITELSAVIRIAFIIFQFKAANHVLSGEAARNSPDMTQLVSHGACIAGGVFLLRRCGYFASFVKHRFIERKNEA